MWAALTARVSCTVVRQILFPERSHMRTVRADREPTVRRALRVFQTQDLDALTAD
jgi:hypothetical protein